MHVVDEWISFQSCYTIINAQQRIYKNYSFHHTLTNVDVIRLLAIQVSI